MIGKLLAIILKRGAGIKGIVIMSIVSFSEAIFFLVPPDPFLGFLCIKKSYKYILKITLICLFFSIAGGCISYFLGDELVNYAIENNIGFISNNLDKIESIKDRIDKDTFLLMLTSGFTPLPFKVFCITAGALNVKFLPFLFGAIIGRLLRFSLVAYLAKILGEKFKSILKSKEVVYLSIALVVILIIYFIYKWI